MQVLFSNKTITSKSKNLLFLFVFIVLQQVRGWGQCTGGTNVGSLSVSTSWQTISINGNEYRTFSALAGVTYEFSFYNNGGGSSYDSYLTLLDNSNSSITYSDDYSGDDAYISWTCTTSGTYRILATKYQCVNQSGLGTLAYKCDCLPTGDQTSYGNGSWVGYVYNSSSAGSFTTYRGTVTEIENFDRDMSTGTPSGATTNICSANSNLFATRYKMNKSYIAGVYTFTIGADDGVRLSIDGGSTWLINDWADHGYRTLTGSAYLSGSTNVVLEYYENGGSARVSVSSTMASPTTMQVPTGFTNSVKYATCSGTFYDAGGSGSNYSNNENYTVTFYPSTTNGKVRLTFSSFAVEACCDWLKIFNGNSIGATLLGTYTSSPGTITSTASDGSLTIQFYSDGSTTGAGWAATVSCYSPDYITQWVSMSVGSSDWCAGESRQVTVTIKNNGLLPWSDASGVDFNIGVKWNAEADYYVRVDAQNLAAGATATYSLTVTAPSTTGSNNLTFDVVRESCFWFANNTTACGYTAGPGNTVYSSGALNIKASPTNVDAGINTNMCLGNSINLSGSATGSSATIFSENFESYADVNLTTITSPWRQTGTGNWDIWQEPLQAYTGLKGLAVFVGLNLTYNNNDNIIAYYNGLIDATSYTSIKLNFYWKAQGQYSGATLYDYGKVVYSLNGTTWTELSENYYNQGSAWQYADINLSAVAGQQFYIGFKWISNGTVINPPGFIIDDITITGTRSTTYSWLPSGSLSASNISNPVATPTVTTTYTMTATSNGCSVTDNVVITVNNPASTSLANGDIVWHGGTSSAWATLANWKQYNGSTYINPVALPSSATNVIIPVAGTCVSNSPSVAVSGTSTVNNITIETGASLTMNSNSELNVNGNWVNNGSFNAGTGTVNFNGTSSQTINTSNTRETFYNLTVNKTNGTLDLNDSVQVNNLLTLTNGKITTTNTNILTLLINSTYTASTTIGSATSFVNGPMAYKISSTSLQSLKLPIGLNNDWRPVELNLTHSTTTPYTYTAKLYNNSANSLGWSLPVGIERLSYVHYVDVERTPSSSVNLTSATIKMYYNNTNGSDDGVIDATKLSIAKASILGSIWSDIGGTGATNTSGSITSSSFNSFSRFSLSNKNTGTNPLPVELTDFSVACQNQQVKLNWSTQSETNNDFFGIERSADGLLFNEIGKVTGYGNTNVTHNYQYFDEQALKGISYYRLNQHDFNGVTKIYPMKSVNCDDETDAISIYPNPNTGTFDIIGVGIESTINITDVLSKTVYSAISKSTKETLKLVNVNPGVYFIEVKNQSGKISTQKIIVE